MKLAFSIPRVPTEPSALSFSPPKGGNPSNRVGDVDNTNYSASRLVSSKHDTAARNNGKQLNSHDQDLLTGMSSSTFPDFTEATAWFDEIAGPGATSCSTVRQKLQENQWMDPNEGKLYVRRILSPPHFYISLHNEDYDPVRFRAIFNNGDYYERRVMDRFQIILAESNDYETSTIKTSDSNNGRYPIVLDVGGNIGYYSLLSAARNHAVLTFEINPTNLIRICESIHLNRPSHLGVKSPTMVSSPQLLPHGRQLDQKEQELIMAPIKLFRLAVSNQSNVTWKVAIPRRNPGEANVESIAGSRIEQVEKSTLHHSFVSSTTLDQFAQQRQWFDGLQRHQVFISILKVDTEGHETQILEGARRLIQSGLVRNVLLEYRKNGKEAVEILFEAGYVLVYDGTGSTPSIMLTVATSRAYLDKGIRIEDDKYQDLWFRLASCPLPPKSPSNPSMIAASSRVHPRKGGRSG